VTRAWATRDGRVREGVRAGAGRGGRPQETVPACAKRFKDPEPGVRVQAALALWNGRSDQRPSDGEGLVLRGVDLPDRWERWKASCGWRSRRGSIHRGLRDVLLDGVKEPRRRVRAQRSAACGLREQQAKNASRY